ncbi:MAG: cytochrome c oxidase accessory protein CcoG, partial [Novosphingobium sp.]|nr:cytochrome c oxidase accessory protein CcoG [Novosphingobium sp.]
ACDRVMKDIGRPRGLIDYATLEDSESEKAGNPPKSHLKLIWHPRTIAYFMIWGAIGLALLFALGVRSRLDLSVAPDRNPPYMLMSDGSVRNAYTLKLRNMQSRPRKMEITLEGLPGGVMWSGDMSADAAARALTRTVESDAIDTVRAYVIVPGGAKSQDFSFALKSLGEDGESDTVETYFEAPGGE